ncbi:MAG: HEAT repeat domain-containing protein, partial [Rhizobiales bacterium]|nr:HEAT repeat domain-containing protein [Hyphomicrobiales bacterium]
MNQSEQNKVGNMPKMGHGKILFLTLLYLYFLHSPIPAYANDQKIVKWVEKLRNGTKQERISAAAVLGSSSFYRQKPQIIKALVTALKDPEREVRIRAVYSLFRAKGKSATQALLLTMKNDKSADIRLAAAQVLGRAGDKRTVDTLELALDNKSYIARSTAADILGTLKSAQSVKHLLKKLQDPHHEVRISVVRSLGHLRSKKAVKPLTSLLSDNLFTLRREAAIALG